MEVMAWTKKLFARRKLKITTVAMTIHLRPRRQPDLNRGFWAWRNISSKHLAVTGRWNESKEDIGTIYSCQMHNDRWEKDNKKRQFPSAGRLSPISSSRSWNTRFTRPITLTSFSVKNWLSKSIWQRHAFRFHFYYFFFTFSKFLPPF